MIAETTIRYNTYDKVIVVSAYAFHSYLCKQSTYSAMQSHPSHQSQQFYAFRNRVKSFSLQCAFWFPKYFL